MDLQQLAQQVIDSQLLIHASLLSQTMDKLDKGVFFALHYLLLHDGKAYPNEIGRHMGVSSARMATLVAHLEKDGFITKKTDSTDHRKTRLELTAKGKMDILEKRQEAIRLVAEVFKELGEANTREYMRLSHQIIQIILQNEKKRRN